MSEPTSLRVDHAVTSGTFSLDGETFDVENNIWVIGDDNECIVIDAPHSVPDILAVVGDRTVLAIMLTHAHDDHSRSATDLREAVDSPIMLHRADRPLWEITHPDSHWDGTMVDRQVVRVAGSVMRVLHTPGHTPGSVCFYIEELRCVFTGDTLFKGGPGATGRSFSDATVLDASIRDKLSLCPATRSFTLGTVPTPRWARKRRSSLREPSQNA